ncbi:uncharacterized protein [Misgurnus anguillicaudatus]|uniref:uncharacterized protein n=1 Tax=Misgurnus anguillicaudatus TaxID=75329 RepID=UPI003CCF59E2
MPPTHITARAPFQGLPQMATGSNTPLPQMLSGPPSTVQIGHSNVSQPISACVQSSSALGPPRVSAVERPSFPYFKTDDPQEFAMLNMALRNLLPAEETEQYKYHILLDHLKLDAARHLALAYAHDPQPYTTALKALQRKYGQPQHLVLREIAFIQSLPAIHSGDSTGFSQFALRVQALVGMLQSWGQNEGANELACASHVHQLLSKLPANHVSNFARHARAVRPDVPYNLVDFAKWLEEEAECQSLVVQVSDQSKGATKFQSRDGRPLKSLSSTATFLQGINQEGNGKPYGIVNQSNNSNSKQLVEPQNFCAFCGRTHHLNQCPEFLQFDVNAKRKWILDNNRCWRCGRKHHSSNCNLRRDCPSCKECHLAVLHEVNAYKPDSGIFYLSKPSGLNSVLLKVVKVILSAQGKTLETYAILDDGSEKTMLLSPAAEMLGLNGAAECLKVRTIRQGIEEIDGANVTFSVSPATLKQKKYQIKAAFTAKMLDLPEQTYPIHSLQRCYQHIKDIPLEEFHQVKPLLLIGADHPHLLCSTERVVLGPPGSPAALHTRLGWVLQGPIPLVQKTSSVSQCHFLASSSMDPLQMDVEKMWHMNVIPYVQMSNNTHRSRQDQEALECLEKRTERVEVNGMTRSSTLLLCAKHAPKEFHTSGESSQDAAPEESSQDAAPEESSQDAAPEESSQDAAPEESSQDAAPEESSQDAAPEESPLVLYLKNLITKVLMQILILSYIGNGGIAKLSLTDFGQALLETISTWFTDSPKVEGGWKSLFCVPAVGMVVDLQLPRGLWPIGTVTKVLPSSDGIVRVVNVLIDFKHYVRLVNHFK